MRVCAIIRQNFLPGLPAARLRNLVTLRCSAPPKRETRMLNKPAVTESLARHIAATRWDDIPSRVRHQAKRSLINFFAVTLAGCRSRPIETALRSLSEFSGGKQVALIGREERIDALSAAFLNAAGANVDDFCDTHTATVIHPTAPVAGALFSYAGLRELSGN